MTVEQAAELADAVDTRVWRLARQEYDLLADVVARSLPTPPSLSGRWS